jgi:hypothetical protein
LWPKRCALITDPPYGISYRSGMVGRGFKGRKRAGVERTLAVEVAGDEDTSERDAAMAMAWSVAAVWGPRKLWKTPPWMRLDELGNVIIEPREVLAHDKKGVGMGDLSLPWKPSWETIAIYGDGWVGKRTDGVVRGAVVPFGAGSASNGRTHPNQKPLSVCAELIDKAPPGLPVVDPFAGSGAILLAAALLGRDAYGAEIADEHFESCASWLVANGVRVVAAQPAAA